MQGDTIGWFMSLALSMALEKSLLLLIMKLICSTLC